MLTVARVPERRVAAPTIEPRQPHHEHARRAVAAMVQAATRSAVDALALPFDARVLRVLPLAVPALAVLLSSCVLLVWQLML